HGTDNAKLPPPPSVDATDHSTLATGNIGLGFGLTALAAFCSALGESINNDLEKTDGIDKNLPTTVVRSDDAHRLRNLGIQIAIALALQ
ncbi:1708_t:CDS:2, partial [Racocetra fulgida]